MIESGGVGSLNQQEASNPLASPLAAVGVALLLVLAVVGFAGEHYALDALRPFVPSMLAVTCFLDVATGCVLLALCLPRPFEPARAVIGVGFLVSGALVLCSCFALQTWPWATNVAPPSAQAAPWLILFWHLGTAISGILYARVRSQGYAASLSAAVFVRRSATIGIAYVAVAVSTSVVLGRFLPPFADGISLESVRTSGVGLVAVLAVAYAVVRVAQLRPAVTIDRAYVLSLACIATGTALVVMSNTRYDVSWYVARVLFCASSVFVLVFAIGRLIESHERFADAEAALVRSEGESGRRADRIHTLRRLAADCAPADEHVRAVLATAATTLRTGARTCAVLARVDGDVLRVDEVAWSRGAESVCSALFPGAIVPVQRTIFASRAQIGGTRSWNALAAVNAPGMLCYELGWQRMIFAPVQVGRESYVLVFGVLDEAGIEPFDDEDEAYVEVLAAFIAHRFSERQHSERLQFQIEHDPLTGLHNRAQFRAVLRRATSAGEPFVLAILDLDDFRCLNRTFGQMIADEVLVEVGVAIRATDERDFVARLGGDKFAIVLFDVDSHDDAHARLGRYLEPFEQPFQSGDREGTRLLDVAASVGAACYPRDGASADELICSADVALDVAKEQCCSSVVLFDREMASRLESVFLKSAELNEAIDHDGLTLLYQPTFDLATRRITGAEALVRWNHPKLGVLPPDEFIAFAERNGIIGRLSLWVMHRLIDDLSGLTHVPDGFRCYFNLATRQIDDITFIDDLEARLRRSPGINRHVGIEITETAAIYNMESAIYALDRFRRLGLTLAIDDFGTGYSSLSYLKRLPVDIIKIDRSFVDDVPHDPKGVALCELLVAAADRFGLTALAEGIESEAQLTWLRDAGCRSGQGYLISPPVPFAEMIDMLGVARPASQA